MRKISSSQPNLTYSWLDLDHAKELQTLSGLLDEHPKILDLVWQDLSPDAKHPTGARGMTAEQVFRALVIKQMNRFSYRELHFHLADSQSYRTFCRLSFNQQVPSKSTLAANIKRLCWETLEEINRLLVRVARERGIEKGAKVRVDCTVVETLIHAPSDSQQLWDAIRVLLRLMRRARKLLPAGVLVFTDRQRSAKRRCREIATARNKKLRLPPYRALLKIAREVLQQAQTARQLLEQHAASCGLEAIVLGGQLQHYLHLTEQVIEQTQRRVVQGESVPAGEKIVSIFEEHTDIIRKDYKETYYGHKICLSTGTSSMVLDCQILDGNPGDSTLAVGAVTRHQQILEQAPRQVVFDGAFASKENLEKIKKLGSQDVVFTKGRYLSVSDMAKSTWVYRNLKRFRAGIEGCISFLKHSFGLERCTWRSLPSFKSYVWSSILACNLLLMARALMP